MILLEYSRLLPIFEYITFIYISFVLQIVLYAYTIYNIIKSGDKTDYIIHCVCAYIIYNAVFFLLLLILLFAFLYLVFFSSFFSFPFSSFFHLLYNLSTILLIFLPRSIHYIHSFSLPGTYTKDNDEKKKQKQSPKKREDDEKKIPAEK